MDLKANIERMEKELADYNERANKTLAEMRANLEQSNKPYGWLKEGVEYYCLHSYGEADKINEWSNSFYDRGRMAMGNVYKTKELAEQASDRQLAKVRIINALREREGDWVADWRDFNQQKYYVYYQHESNRLILDTNTFCQVTESEMYSTRSAWQWVIDNMVDDVNLYFLGLIYDPLD